ncbi:ATP-binding protein [Streptomyces sp. TLI_105]|uniref:ATP-binding protein n=1 Tax=Streptomyces sp. TLI_105 TaxID=1881019 RepID=UPI000896C0FE|nr:ATP-binding protein [Streptomyces sp. TLI_105]SED34479.1 hypothetical protein SAMN05428939_4939 [Streptomyces sp. TLI_105]
MLEGVPDEAAEPPQGAMPPPPWAFTNQEKVLKRLLREADRPWEGRPRVVLLSGPAGSGSTSVTLRLGAEARDRFPDGQYYVDLRATSGETGPEPAGVVLRLLREMDEAERVAVPPLSDRHAKQLVRKVAGPEQAARVKAQLPGVLERCRGNAFALHAKARLLTRDRGRARARVRDRVRDRVRGSDRDAIRDVVGPSRTDRRASRSAPARPGGGAPVPAHRARRPAVPQCHDRGGRCRRPRGDGRPAVSTCAERSVSTPSTPSGGARPRPRSP